MKIQYVDEHRAIADLAQPGFLQPDWTIVRINVPANQRGNGYGTAMLQRILADADQENVTLYLCIFPSGPLNYDQLYDWYSRNGFVMQVDGYMKRTPNGQNNHNSR